MTEKVKSLDYDRWCFACGADNPIGLKLKFRQEGDAVVCDFMPEKKHQGFLGIMHGGITSVILDEVMAQYVMIVMKKLAVTIRLETKFRKPVEIGSRIRAMAFYESSKRGFHFLRAEIRDEGGDLLASAKSVFAEKERG